MRMYVHFSKPFEQMYHSFFRQSLPANFECTPTLMPPALNDVLCARPDYFKWVTQYKLDVIEFERGNTIAISGCDFLFNGQCHARIMELLNTNEIMAFDDGGHACMDFLVLRCTPVVIDMFRRIRDYHASFKSDQTCLNSAMKTTDVAWRLLPHNEFWNVSKSLPTDRAKTFPIPESIPPPVEGLWSDDLSVPMPPK